MRPGLSLLASSLLLSSCAPGDRLSAARDQAAGEKQPRFTRTEFERLSFLLGCWEGRRPGAQDTSIVRVVRRAADFEIAVGGDCTSAIPLLHLTFRDGIVEAAEPPGRQTVVHGRVFRWVARAVSSDELRLAPDFAPTWEGFKIVAPGTIKWSSAPADASAEPSSFLLKRVEAAR